MPADPKRKKLTDAEKQWTRGFACGLATAGGLLIGANDTAGDALWESGLTLADLRAAGVHIHAPMDYERIRDSVKLCGKERARNNARR